MKPPPEPAAFDHVAADYEAALGRGLQLAGETREFFARGRVAWLARCLPQPAPAISKVLDFGCGDGAATPLLRRLEADATIIGVDTSTASLELAQRNHATDRIRFLPVAALKPDASFDLVFSNGVFHHVPSADCPATLALIHSALRPGGLFALWENNPWNPGTRLIMRRVPFDHDAVLLWPAVARRLLRVAGFDVLRTDFRFVFPRWLRWFRPLEPALSRLPLGGQYQVLAQKPPAPTPPDGR